MERWILKAARFEAVHELKNHYPIILLVVIYKLLRAGYCKWRKTQRIRSGEVAERLDHERTHHGHSSFTHLLWLSRITVALKKEGFCVNHKRVYRLMKDMNIQSIIRKKRRYFGRKASVVQPNRLN
ncbi:IS3 family transposase [Bacillus subtilis]|uniref:IS3 family transposase n=1 Tax=Bacillus subtilis TaxID=1423 RepID=UPI000C77EFA2